jgi:hypothetical protein
VIQCLGWVLALRKPTAVAATLISFTLINKNNLIPLSNSMATICSASLSLLRHRIAHSLPQLHPVLNKICPSMQGVRFPYTSFVPLSPLSSLFFRSFFWLPSFLSCRCSPPSNTLKKRTRCCDGEVEVHSTARTPCRPPPRLSLSSFLALSLPSPLPLRNRLSS